MSLAKKTEEFIQGHPSVKDCLKKGLINYSALARLIQEELGIKKKSGFNAILVASRRTQEKLLVGRESEKQIREIVKKGRLEIKNKVAVLVFSPKTPLSSLIDSVRETPDSNENFHLVQGANAITLVMGEEFCKDISESFKGFLFKKHTGLVEITIKSPQAIEETPGIVSYLYSLFAEHGINIVETLSCWTDTLFIIEEKDLGKAMEILKF